MQGTAADNQIWGRLLPFRANAVSISLYLLSTHGLVAGKSSRPQTANPYDLHGLREFRAIVFASGNGISWPLYNLYIYIYLYIIPALVEDQKSTCLCV